MPPNGKSTARFQLPQLKPVNYSLTDGTNIPPPPESPIEESPPAPKPEASQTSTPSAANGKSAAANANGSRFEQPPLSPASTRPGSVRRFLSKDVSMIDRPESSLSFASGRPGLIKKKSGSWFRRIGSAGQSANRTSVVYEEKKVPMGPPPPKLPELSQLKAKISGNDEGSLGGEDMFKNIK